MDPQPGIGFVSFEILVGLPTTAQRVVLLNILQEQDGLEKILELRKMSRNFKEIVDECIWSTDVDLQIHLPATLFEDVKEVPPFVSSWKICQFEKISEKFSVLLCHYWGPKLRSLEVACAKTDHQDNFGPCNTLKKLITASPLLKTLDLLKFGSNYTTLDLDQIENLSITVSNQEDVTKVRSYLEKKNNITIQFAGIVAEEIRSNAIYWIEFLKLLARHSGRVDIQLTDMAILDLISGEVDETKGAIYRLITVINFEKLDLNLDLRNYCQFPNLKKLMLPTKTHGDQRIVRIPDHVTTLGLGHYFFVNALANLVHLDFYERPSSRRLYRRVRFISTRFPSLKSIHLHLRDDDGRGMRFDRVAESNPILFRDPQRFEQLESLTISSTYDCTHGLQQQQDWSIGKLDGLQQILFQGFNVVNLRLKELIIRLHVSSGLYLFDTINLASLISGRISETLVAFSARGLYETDDTHERTELLDIIRQNRAAAKGWLKYKKQFCPSGYLNCLCHDCEMNCFKYETI